MDSTRFWQSVELPENPPPDELDPDMGVDPENPEGVRPEKPEKPEKPEGGRPEARWCRGRGEHRIRKARETKPLRIMVDSRCRIVSNSLTDRSCMMIQQVSTVHQQQTELNKLRLAHNDASFQSMLKERIEQRSSESVRLSRHAQERAQQAWNPDDCGIDAGFTGFD